MDSEDEKAVDVLTDRIPVITCSKCGCEIDVADLDAFVRVECPDCSNIETVPARLGPFLLLNMIGRGGMGGVYYAKDESLGRFVAIKVMLKSIGDNKDFVESFKREAQSIARLNHPNIVQIYSFGQEKGQPFIVMELVSGQRFDKMVESKKELDQALVIRIGLDIAEGLKAAEEAGLLHGDIKPENILLDEKAHAKLVDFGIASFANQKQGDGIWGTPYYIAPEKIRRQRVDGRSDIYSLGATLYHALAGRPPFEGSTPIEVVKARLVEPAKPVHVIRKDIDPTVEKVIMRMLEADPARRYPNYNSLISDLRKAAEALGSPGAVTGYASEIAKKTGKIYITKKRGTSPIPLPASGEIPPPQPTRMVLHRKTGAASNQAVTYPTGSVPRPVGEKRPLTETQKKARRRRVVAVVWVFVILGLIGGGVAIAVHTHKKKQGEYDRRREAFALAGERNKAVELLSRVLLVTSNVVTLADKIQPYPAKATEAVFDVLGEPLDLPPPPPPELSAATNAPAEGAPTAPDAAAAAVAAVPPAPAATNAIPDKPAELAVEPPRNPEPPADEPEIKKLTRRVIAGVGKAAAQGQSAKEVEATSIALRNGAVAAAESDVAAAKVKALSQQLDTAKTLEADIQTAAAEAEKSLGKVMELRTLATADREARIKAEEDEKRRAAEDEEKNRQAEALKKKAEEELGLVDATRNNCQPMLKQHRFDEIVEALNGQLASYQTEEGKAAFKAILDRYKRLISLKKFLIERLNKAPFRWGYMLSRTSSVDVLSADDKGIKIKDRSILWTDISLAQMMKFIDHYVNDRALPIRTLGEQNLNAGIFVFENGGAKAAPAFVNRAVDLCPDLAEEAQRLLPLD